MAAWFWRSSPYCSSRYHDQFRLDWTGLGVGRWGMALVVVAAATAIVIFVERPYAAMIASVLVVAELLVLSPRGFYYERKNPYSGYAFVEELQQLTATPESPGSSASTAWCSPTTRRHTDFRTSASSMESM